MTFGSIPITVTTGYLSDHNSSIPIVKYRTAPDGRTWVTLWVNQCVPGWYCFFPEKAPNKGRSTYWAVYDPEGEMAAEGYVKGFDQAQDSTRKACKRRWQAASFFDNLARSLVENDGP